MRFQFRAFLIFTKYFFRELYIKRIEKYQLFYCYFITKHFFQNYIYIYIIKFFIFYLFYCNKKRKMKFDFRSSIVVLDRRSRTIIRSIIFSLNNVIERRVLFRLHAIVAKSFDRVIIISLRTLFILRSQIFILF